MAINMDTLVEALSNANTPANIYKVSTTSEGAGTWHSLWKIGGNPAAGSNPPAYTAGSGYIPTRATTGAIGQTNAAGGNNKYIAQASFTGSTAGSIVIYDRLWACSGLTTNSATTLNITTPGTLTSGRDPKSGLDVEPWIEVYTAPGATGAIWTLTGTDSTGTTGRTWTYTHPANAETIGQMMPMVNGTAVGGCRVPSSLGFGTASGTAGDVGITLLRRLCTIPLPVINVTTVLDAFATGMPEVYDDACLAMMVQCTTTNTGVLLGYVSATELTP